MYVLGKGPGKSHHRDWLVAKPSRGRALSALQLPWFTVLPPVGFGVLTTIGRRTAQKRRKCVRAILREDRAYIVAIGGERSAWLKNVRAHPSVHLRLRGGSFAGTARDLDRGAEAQAAFEAYCETVNPFDYLECMAHGRGRPSRAKIRDLHRGWFERGTPLVVELSDLCEPISLDAGRRGEARSPSPRGRSVRGG